MSDATATRPARARALDEVERFVRSRAGLTAEALPTARPSEGSLIGRVLASLAALRHETGDAPNVFRVTSTQTRKDGTDDLRVYRVEVVVSPEYAPDDFWALCSCAYGRRASNRSGCRHALAALVHTLGLEGRWTPWHAPQP